MPVHGVIDYDGQSESLGDKNLGTVNRCQNFVLQVDWRIKDTPFINHDVPIILPDGNLKKDSYGKIMRISVPDSDSGIFYMDPVKLSSVSGVGRMGLVVFTDMRWIQQHLSKSARP